MVDGGRFEKDGSGCDETTNGNSGNKGDDNLVSSSMSFCNAKREPRHLRNDNDGMVSYENRLSGHEGRLTKTLDRVV